jgi:RNA polymerase sigma-70 factor (ECF subfamily)
VISPAELSRLWRAHAAALELLARTRCRSPEDCVQEAFIRLAKQACAPDDPLAWLARVVRNEAISQARANERRWRREQQVASWQSPWLEPAQAGDEGLSADEVEKALRNLDEAVREVVVAHLWGGLTFRQIADAFEMSRSTVHRRYLSALEQLREHLGLPLSENVQ